MGNAAGIDVLSSSDFGDCFTHRQVNLWLNISLIGRSGFLLHQLAGRCGILSLGAFRKLNTWEVSLGGVNSALIGSFDNVLHCTALYCTRGCLEKKRRLALSFMPLRDLGIRKCDTQSTIGQNLLRSIHYFCIFARKSLFL